MTDTTPVYMCDTLDGLSRQLKFVKKRDHGFEPRISPWKGGMLPLHQSRNMRVEGFVFFYRIPYRGALLLASLPALHFTRTYQV